MLNKDAARAMVEKIGAQTRYYATILIVGGEQSVTRFANSEINQNVTISDATVSLTLYDGKKEATCSTNVLTDEGLRKLVEQAENILPHIPEGEFERFPISDEAIPEMATDPALAKAFGIAERAAFIKDGVSGIQDGFTAAGALTLGRQVIAFGNNQGVFRFSEGDQVQFNTVVTHADGAAGSADCVSYQLDDLDIGAAFAKAQRTADRARHPVSIDIGAYTVILSPVAVGDLMTFVTMPHNAKWVDDGISYTLGKMGEKVFGDTVTLRDDYSYPGLCPLPFDFEGNKRQAVTLVENGVVKSLLYDNKNAARNKVQTTGHAVSNKGQGGYPFHLIMEGGDQSLQEIIAGTPKGIYINEFHYTNYVNPRTLQLTGLTRNGAFLIEDGKIGPAITTMRFTQSLIDSLNAVTAISKERTKVNAFDGAIYLMPAVRIDNFHFTSKQ